MSTKKDRSMDEVKDMRHQARHNALCAAADVARQTGQPAYELASHQMLVCRDGGDEAGYARWNILREAVLAGSSDATCLIENAATMYAMLQEVAGELPDDSEIKPRLETLLAKATNKAQLLTALLERRGEA